MFVGIWFAAIGLVFGWCAILVSGDTGFPLWGRGLISAAVSAVAAVLFDAVAFEGANLTAALVGGMLGGGLAVAAHYGITASLERRPRVKARTEPNESM